MRILGILAVLLVVTANVPGCSNKPPPPSLQVKFGKGFYEREQLRDAAWRWMADEGVVRLENTGKDTFLKIEGRVPVPEGKFKRQPAMKVTLNGATLETFTAPVGVFQRTYLITPGQQGTDGWSELRLATDLTMIPKEIEPGSGDTRKLGFQLTELTWAP